MIKFIKIIANNKMKKNILLFIILASLNCFSFANQIMDIDAHNPSNINPIVFVWLVVFIFLSRSLSIVKKIGLPMVVGEILSGIILGDLSYFGINIFVQAENNEIVKFMAELGAIILMFEIGLESKLSDLSKNFKTGFAVAITGSIFTFIGGFFISKYLIPNPTTVKNLLFGVITAATATGVSAKTFKDMKIIHTKEVKLALVASILDELISILVFGIISSLIINKAVDLFHLSVGGAQVLGFFIFATLFGKYMTPFLAKWSIKIHGGINMKLGILLINCFLLSWVAYISGLATVIGAFIAGLMLDQIYFDSFSKTNFIRTLRNFSINLTDQQAKIDLANLIQKQESKHLEELIKPLSHMFVPVFFIYIGLMLKINVLFQINTLLVVITILVVSFTGRLASGFFVRKSRKLNNLIIGLGMTPIGEAGLIFAMFGKSMGILGEHSLAIVVATVGLAAIVSPILIKLAINYKGINE